MQTLVLILSLLAIRQKEPEVPQDLPPQRIEEDLGDFTITAYYAPSPGQDFYYQGSYDAEMRMNCSGDCLVTSDNTRLQDSMALTVVACPPELDLGQILHIEGHGDVVCHDRGGAIKGRRIDIWAGEGENAMARMQSGWSKKVLTIKKISYVRK